MKKKNINVFLSKYFNYLELPNIYVLDIKYNSCLVKKYDLFIAVKGLNLDGKIFIFDAVYNGAISVLTYSDIKDKSYYFYDTKYNIFIFYLWDLNFLLSYIAADFYGNFSKKIPILGITGTNGKTTVTSFSSQWLDILDYKSCLLSTIGNGFYNNLSYSLNTTSSPIDIYRNLRDYYNLGSEFISMEVSSHSLSQYRVESLFFSAAVFTNLTLDHLDYHINFKNYELAKWRLFSEFKINNLIINIDDNIGYKWYKKIFSYKVIPVTFNKFKIKSFKYRWLYVKYIKYFGFLKKIYFNSYWGNGILNIFFIGYFNIKNLLLSFVSLLSLGFNFKDLIYNSKYLSLPEGRMEFFKNSNKSTPLVIVDYAHTPDALKNVLIESRKYCLGNLWCIFGCTGNRDKSKRSLMGFIANKYSDYVVITNDDLYSENELSILKDIKLGINNFNNVYIILNRILAIKFAIKNSFSNDVILIAGKGHERFHILYNKKIKYSDRYLVNKLLGINKC